MIARRRASTLPGEFEHISKCIRRNDIGNPESIADWEHALASYVGLRHAAAVNSGRRGMALTLQYLGLGPGDELIIPAYTYKELIPPIQQLGITPVPADIDRETLVLSPQTIETRITKKTKAIMALHTFGVPFDVDGILDIGRRHGLPIIEDCAHSLGASVNGKQTGSFGYASFFSFESIKPVNTFGGGAVVSNDEQLIQSIRDESSSDAPNLELLKKKVRSVRLEQQLFSTGLAVPLLFLLSSPSLRHLGKWLYTRSQHSVPSHASYTPLQAELGLKKLDTLDERIRQRERMSQFLRHSLKPEICVQQVGEGCRSSCYSFVIICPSSAVAVRRRLLRRGIDAGIEGELTDNCAEILRCNDCPNLEDLYPRLMSLPLYDDISEKIISRVADAVNACV